MMRGIARLTQDGEVKFASWQPADAASRRQIRLSEILSGSGVVPRVLDVHTYHEATFVLTESPGTRTLASIISEWERRGASPRETSVPIDQALRLMLNMLRGLDVMEHYGVAHGDLTESNIYVMEDNRTLIDDFRSACIVGSTDEETSCAGLAGTLCGSAFRHAPEMKDGIPSRLENNIWQLGLVFARLLLGDIVPQWAKRDFDDSTGQGRRHIREFTYRHFSIWDDAEFKRLYPAHSDVLRIVAGMLEPDPRRRWTTQMALQSATQAAAQRGIPAGGERQAPKSPFEWSEDMLERKAA
eukprot:CAMPEP_0176223864 /NCGR_PEP_ID=MMETSP0121_2-20121125/20963_1 /TAXON_ID=160619 /ORGANISM="Kryptoperidinium foliaceum, Strain CCMP 1326" /LENGTH=298 /DNA_ID=CAMNT_0017563109 /DNA_START=1 /DNA_END=895 /DNA_ORIENTATION=-